MKKNILLIVALVAAVSTQVFAHESTKVAEVVDMPGHGEALIGGEFTLIDQDNRKRSSKEFLGKYMLVYFGYGTCPHVCPTALGAMTTALSNIKAKIEKIQPLFISVDPDRDTPESLGQLKAKLEFHEKILMLTGGQTAVDQAKTAYKVYATKAKALTEDSNYDMDHTSLIYLMDPKGKFITAFPHEVDPKHLENELKRLIIE